MTDDNHGTNEVSTDETAPADQSADTTADGNGEQQSLRTGVTGRRTYLRTLGLTGLLGAAGLASTDTAAAKRGKGHAPFEDIDGDGLLETDFDGIDVSTVVTGSLDAETLSVADNPPVADLAGENLDIENGVLNATGSSLWAETDTDDLLETAFDGIDVGTVKADSVETADLGTTDYTPLELAVDGSRALRLEPAGSESAVNVVAGHPANSAGPGVTGATISGGGVSDLPNEVTYDSGVALNGYLGGTIGGGIGNTVSGFLATVGGGALNTASGYSATVPGGEANEAAGRGSFAVGTRAKATHDGAFVLGDSSYTTITSEGTDEVRSQMPIYAPAFNQTSARAKKTAVEPVDRVAVLQTVKTMDVNTWEFEQQPDGRHMGPMAEEFATAFDLGTDDEHIATVDADGVALAAIQGLAAENDERAEAVRKLEAENEAKDRQIADLREQNTELEARLDAENDALRERNDALEDHLDAVEERLAALESDPTAA